MTCTLSSQQRLSGAACRSGVAHERRVEAKWKFERWMAAERAFALLLRGTLLHLWSMRRVSFGLRRLLTRSHYSGLRWPLPHLAGRLSKHGLCPCRCGWPRQKICSTLATCIVNHSTTDYNKARAARNPAVCSERDACAQLACAMASVPAIDFRLATPHFQ